MLLAVVAIGGQAILLAWVLGEGLGRLIEDPLTRVYLAGVVTAGVAAFALTARSARTQPTEPDNASTPESSP